MQKLFLTLCLISGLLIGEEILYFMPYEQQKALNHIIALINGAKSNINISIYSFTNKEIAKALKNAGKRGVSVNIIYDKESNTKNPHSTIGYLSKYQNINTCLLSGLQDHGKKFKGLMHQKMAIIDHLVLILGSANWSKNAFQNNYETLFMTSNQAIIQKALNTFSKMFQQCQPY
ncbi:nuclease NucT [Helicobacter enhydrae]|uniref:phospholipase D n=1 Tax=Helicobacter enhydrae TaxID=222136 RepID=A0A1B1U6Q9_9HELI|nr:phospholipase D-like domain-containing protein [Helicobacter enhydrae]ANV98430.1 nuclease NucT [Helicobacter enhydrae]